jgi:hypothetical protein
MMTDPAVTSHGSLKYVKVSIRESYMPDKLKTTIL